MYGGDADQEQKTDIVSVLSDQLGQGEEEQGCWVDNIKPAQIFSALGGCWHAAGYGHIAIIPGAIEMECDRAGLKHKERAEMLVLLRVMEDEARRAINKRAS